MGNNRNKIYPRKRQFKGNKFCKRVSVFNNEKISINSSIPTASKSKLINSLKPADVPEDNEKNVIFNLGVLCNISSLLCCHVYFERKVSVVQDSVFGLALNMTLKCENCDYSFSFCTSEKVNKLHSINLAFVFSMRIIGKGHSAAKKLCSAINIDAPSKRAFGFLEKKLEFAASNVACNTMKEAALEIRSNKTDTEISQCGVSVDGTWQRRGYSSLNGCVSVITIDSGKVLDVEFMSKVCRLCNSKNKELNTIHNCVKHVGSSGGVEPLGVYRIFERSVEMRKLQYVNFFSDGNSKGYASVKDIYGKNTVAKCECIGHIQKRVGTKLRKLKSKRKDLGGRGKLTDAFID
ncbi:uncharacterized protein TNCV_3678991 [Trichonephila clavipes]|nr:uncharacterized protein TNCV_3678991 [Trichonephila clavipes]